MCLLDTSRAELRPRLASPSLEMVLCISTPCTAGRTGQAPPVQVTILPGPQIEASGIRFTKATSVMHSYTVPSATALCPGDELLIQLHLPEISLLMSWGAHRKEQLGELWVVVHANNPST